MVLDYESRNSSGTHPPGTVLLLLHQGVSQSSKVAESLVTLCRHTLQATLSLLQFPLQLCELRGGGGGGGGGRGGSTS